LILFFFALSVVLTSFGCSGIVSEKDILGTYHTDLSWGSSTLELKEDHTFVQTIQIKDSSTKQLIGRWKLGDSHDKDSTWISRSLILTPYFDVSQLGQGKRVDLGGLQVEGIGSHLQLSVDTDNGINYFRKPK
jgi:hypothetical protein